MASAAKQSWGFWTQSKLQILDDYLAAFLTASSLRARGAVYLDAFAGGGAGRDRLTDLEFDGSARIAAAASATNDSGFRFTYLRFVELNRTRADDIRKEFHSDFPGRDIDVVPGDCNQVIPRLLTDMPNDLTWYPTFAFLDPFGIELRWDTIRALADHKRDRTYKVELFMLFATPAIMRIAGLTPEKAVADAGARLTALFGCDDWQPIVGARRKGLIGGDQAREAFVNVMRWRLAHDLGYQRTHVLEFKNSRGTPLYHMVFASDHDAGDRIMASLYAAAANRNQDMAQDAIAHKTGVQSLFAASEITPLRYKPTPPIEPSEYLDALLTSPTDVE
jgi:three-Cys-motif partner protein